jgi:NAD(P)-dependent dehydrogenase (short-subunit alcohol dehydrogenase family)
MIRYAIVGELAALGAIVHTCGRSQDQLNENLREWKAKGFKVSGSVCDLSSDAEREKLMEEVSSLFDGKLDILVSKISLRFLFAKLTALGTSIMSVIYMETYILKIIRRTKALQKITPSLTPNV